MRKILGILFLFFLCFSAYAQVNQFGEENEENTEKEWYFALRIMPSLNGKLVQTALIKHTGNQKIEIQFVPGDIWLKQIAGLESSQANPNNENFINKYLIFGNKQDSAGNNKNEQTYADIEKIKVVLANLWRLRYSEYPYFNPEMNKEKGWAKHANEKITWMPSVSQMKLLEPYHVYSFTDFFYGEQLFKFLKDVQNRDWQNRYIQASGVYYDTPQN